MTKADVDGYFAGVPEPQRTTLMSLRATLQRLLPGAEQTISYGVPTFKVKRKGVAGFAAYSKHCGYLPMSGSVTTAIADQLEGFSYTKGSIRFPVDQPLPEHLVQRLVDARLAELGFSREDLSD